MKLLVFAALIGLAVSANVNVARDGSASQSSMGWGGLASRAIDGNDAARWQSASCTHSRYGSNNWWKVDLAGSAFDLEYPVSGVTIVNRADCCQNRINGAQVFVGDSLCGTVAYVAGQGTYNVMCTAPILGGSVTVKLASSYLTLCEVKVWVDEDSLPAKPEYTNVALGGSALQSSTGWSGAAARAIDDNTASAWGSGSCTHTSANKNNWWSVELKGGMFGAEYPVSMVTIYNRQDCCQNRINGAKVYVGEELCGTIAYTAAVSVYNVKCAAALKGGSVTVKQASNYLTLCEVQVWVADEAMPEDPPAYTNVAVKGSASQSSVGWGGAAARAVDGKTSGRWGDATCTHSRNAANNWWKVDLEGSESGVEYPVSMVVIYNRQDCCQDRINGAKVYVGEELCGTIAYVAGKAMYKVQCESVLGGGSVTVKQADNYLTLCEVQVYVADDVIPKLPFYNAALGVPTTQTSTGWGGSSSRAVDGNTNGQWSGRSCTHTARGGQSWSATLPEDLVVDNVVIYNRQDCCQNRINGAEVWVGTTKCGTVVYAASVSMYKIQCPEGGIEGNKVTVKAAAGQYLTLCEVKVMVATEEMGTEEMDEDAEA